MIEILVGSVAAVGFLTLIFATRVYYKKKCEHSHLVNEDWDTCTRSDDFTTGLEFSFRRNN